MNSHEFEAHLRSQLHNHATPVDTEAVWRNVQQKRRQRRFVVWFFFGVTLSAALFGAWYTLQLRSLITTPGLPEHPIAHTQTDMLSRSVQQAHTSGTPRASANNSIAFSNFRADKQSIAESKTHSRYVQTDVPRQSGNDPAPMLPQFEPISGYSLQSVPLSRIPLHQPSFFAPERAFSFPLTSVQTKLDAPSRSKQPLRFSIALESGLMATSRNLEALSPVSESIAGLRNKTEQPLETWQVAVLGRLSHSSGWFLDAGISHTRLTERFEDSWSSQTIEQIPDAITEIIIQPGGDTTFVTGPVDAVVTQSWRIRHYNTHTLIDIPLNIGYRFRSDGKWSGEIQAGAVLNLVLNSQGIIWESDLPQTPIDVSNSDSGFFRNKIGLSYLGALNATYDLTEQLVLYGGPQIRVIPSSLTPEANDFSQSYTLFGARLGCRLRF